MPSKVNIGYTNTLRDTQSWSNGDVIYNTTTNTIDFYNGSAWIQSVSSSSNITRSVQTTRRTVGAPSGYYPIYTSTINIDYVGIDYPDVVLKNTSTFCDTWLQLIASPIAISASSITSTTAVANWNNDTYWNGTAFVATPISSYTVEYSTSSTFASAVTTVTGITTTTLAITGLTTATTYYYRITAINGNIFSRVSNTVSFVTL